MTTSKIDTPKVSVIVPVWNTGKVISRCLESLQKQTLKDIEIIVIDDCGTDDAMEYVQNVAAEDARIRILRNEKNEGPGFSRNRGITASLGEYLSFVDSDDYVELDFLEKLYKTAQAGNYDIVKGQIVYETSNGTKIGLLWNNYELQQKLEAGAPLFSVFRAGHVSALYKKQLIIDSHAHYRETRNFEEGIFLLYVCNTATRVAIKGEAIYHYIQRSDSLTKQFDAERLNDHIDGFNELL